MNRMFFAGAYSGEFHHFFAVSISGNSTTTIRSGVQSPSSVSVLPPRIKNLPPNAAIEAGVNFLFLHILSD
jgi:hypothetical protein